MSGHKPWRRWSPGGPGAKPGNLLVVQKRWWFPRVGQTATQDQACPREEMGHQHEPRSKASATMSLVTHQEE